jgi:hypothetical protein
MKTKLDTSNFRVYNLVDFADQQTKNFLKAFGSNYRLKPNDFNFLKFQLLKEVKLTVDSKIDEDKNRFYYKQDLLNCSKTFFNKAKDFEVLEKKKIDL